MPNGKGSPAPASALAWGWGGYAPSTAPRGWGWGGYTPSWSSWGQGGYTPGWRYTSRGRGMWPVSETVTMEKPFRDLAGYLPIEQPPMYGTWPESWYPGMIAPYEHGTYPESWPEELQPDLSKLSSEYAEQFAGQKAVNFPENWDYMADAQKINWLQSSSYDWTLFDKFGREVPKTEAAWSAYEDPFRDVTVVFAMGGGQSVEVDMDLQNVAQIIPDYLERQGKAKAESAEFETAKAIGEEEASKARIYENVKAAILTQDIPYQQKISEMIDAWAKLYGTITPEVENRITREALESLSPEEQARMRAQSIAGQQPTQEQLESMWRTWMTDTGQRIDFYTWLKADMGAELTPKAEEPKEIDAAKLQESLDPYGISVLENYPYLSYITDEQLMRLPPEIIDQMEAYLSSKGVTWRDWLAISGEFYGGRSTPQFRWEIPRQAA